MRKEVFSPAPADLWVVKAVEEGGAERLGHGPAAAGEEVDEGHDQLVVSVVVAPSLKWTKKKHVTALSYSFKYYIIK